LVQEFPFIFGYNARLDSAPQQEITDGDSRNKTPSRGAFLPLAVDQIP
jgi:hypothetical protein